ncbi:MAG: DNA-3-methyladenine glycosylase [Sphingobacteriales bacterium]|nr:DNA-3-methyladenine glycosylase [Sphingobacteriales bacterium]
MKRKKLKPEFFRRKNVLQVARDLLGKILVSNQDGLVTAGRIVEVEAYQGVTDKASHAYGGRRTNRTEVMYARGGVAYVYLCYGIHHLFNVVTNEKEIPHAILVRALEPLEGIETMLARTGKKRAGYSLTRGPGNLSKAMGIRRQHSGYSLQLAALYIADDNYRFGKDRLRSSPRIGVDYAGEDAKRPYRFYLQGNPFVSGKNS